MVTFLAIIVGLTILGFIVTYANEHNNKTTPEVKEQTVIIMPK
jgi:hypothetical protein